MQKDVSNPMMVRRMTGDRRLVSLSSLVVRGDQVLAPILRPFHRSASAAWRPGYQDLFGEEHHNLRAESAAHIRSDYSDRVL